MAEIPRSYLDALTTALNTLSEGTKLVAIQQLAAIEYTDIADLREQVIDILEPLLANSTDAAAAYAATAYDAMRELALGSADGAIAYSGRTPEATAGAVRALVGDIAMSGYETFVNRILDRCDYEIKRAAGEAVAYNSERDDKSEGYARIPQGSETCSFCLMLASFGYRHGDKDKVKHAHPNCDCRIVSCFEGTEIEGYDPDGMYDRYKQCLDSIGGRDGIRAEWDAMSETDRKAYIAKHGGKAGKAFQDYMNKRMAAEIGIRSPDWFLVVKSPTPTYEKPRKDLTEYERAGIDHLVKNGLVPTTKAEDPKADANFDVEINGKLYEMKNVTNAKGSVSNQLTRARKKFYKHPELEKLYIFTSEGASCSFNQLIEGIDKRLRESETAIAFDGEGNMRVIKK